MRLHNHLIGLITAAALTGAVAPVAHAYPIGEGGGGQRAIVAAPQHVAASHHSDSTDWALIAAAGGGAVALIGAGFGGSRHVSRRRASMLELPARDVA